jgi:hypothetical protein
MRVLVFTILFLFTVSANATDNQMLALRTGKVVSVIGISETTLHGSNEPALVLRYQTDNFNDQSFLENEAVDVWMAFQEIVDKKGFKSAVVEAREKPSFFGISRMAGWSWKKGSDCKWHRPDKNDHAYVPRDETPAKIGNIYK